MRNAKTLARAVIARRSQSAFSSIADFIEFLSKLAKGNQNRYYATVFQALRIEVNDEINALKEMLLATQRVLRVGGRLVVMSYHSLEDRLVKRYLRSGNFEGEVPKDEYGRPLSPWKTITRKAVGPTDREIVQNSRARSAKLRIAELI